jgi:hypothetical protein
MSANVPQHKPEDQEIDLMLFFKKIGNFFQWLNTLIFKCIQFFIRKAIVMAALLIIGFSLGFYLDINQKTYNHQVIVAPNFKSTDYLYSKIDLIESKIEEKDTFFLKSIGIKNPSAFSKITVEPIVDVYKFISNNQQNLELLQLMAQNGDLKTVVKESTTSKNYNYHTIILSTNEITTKKDFVEPILNYLSTSNYFSEVQKISLSNIQQKIRDKEGMIVQIDEILKGFSTKSVNNNKNNKLIYYNENTQLNGIIISKDSLVNELGTLKLDLYNSQKIINDNATIMNIRNKTSMNGKRKFIFPLLFISLFILGQLFLSFYKKQSQKHQ